ncbi:MAG: hypothetical protein M5U26_21415 [Planctomycetota bacterium]|nr:hypothetical protein [Planctomycetota bacterium]
MKSLLLASAALLLFHAACAAAERSAVRVICDFEDPAEAAALAAHSENIALDVVQDNGVTRGKNCLRAVGKQGAPWAAMELHGEKVAKWSDFDYFVADVFTEREEKIRVVFELWDADSKNYATRYTDEELATHVGRNTFAWRINRAGRNAKKDGLDWHEIQPKDRIRLDELKKVKIFFTPSKDGGDTVLWFDNLRLMQEDALGGKIKVELPASAKAFDLGPAGTATPGFTTVGAQHPFVTGSVREAGKTWPDPLTGDGLEADGAFTVKFELPDGVWRIWLTASRLLDAEKPAKRFRLKVGDRALADETLTPEEFHGEKGLFRFLRTQYSNREHALWLDYVLPACPEFELEATVAGGTLPVEVENFRLTSFVAVPAAEAEAYRKLAADLRAQRIACFYRGLYFDPHPAPEKKEGDGAYALWVPADTRGILPWTAPDEKERAAPRLDLKSARGQNVIARLCVTSFEDLGEGELTLGALKGPGDLPAARLYYQNYRVHETSAAEMALLPWTKIRFEPGLTWAYWLWLNIPEGAQPGVYEGALSFKPDRGGVREIPLKLEVYPFALAQDLPLSYGMYYAPWKFPEGFDRRKLIGEQLRFMREIGYTAADFGSGNVRALKGDGTVSVEFEEFLPELLKAAGLGVRPEQQQMGRALGMARQIARLLGLRPAVDQQPGIEFTKPELKGYYQDAIRQYKAFIGKSGLPVAVETVDEPREVPNPWNRNLEHTNTYGDWIAEVGGVTSFVTPMGDKQSGKDYTSLVEHHDIVSVHTWEASRGLIERTRAAGKPLWFYNTGKDRLSWGFYAWRMGAVGRWEWHFSWGDGKSADGYPNPGEGFTPFGNQDALAMRAPYATFPGGMLFKSDYLRMAQGIADRAYLETLERALQASADDAAKAAVVKEARAFLEALKKSIPEFPGLKNLASPDAGALVGEGLNSPAAELCGLWRDKAAEFLKILSQ